MEKELFKTYVHDYINLLSSYLQGNSLEGESIDKNKISFYIRLSKFHSLTALLYKAVVETKVSIDESELKRLEECYLSNVRKSVLFVKERETLYQYLNDNKVDYLPLKGLVLQDYYPDSLTREFADNDILFDDSNSNLIRTFFKNRGYEIKLYKRSNHDIYMKAPFYNFEMHRKLFDEIKEFDYLNEYFVNYLKESQTEGSYEHHLKPEDFYIYFTAHSYKHYRNSGCGLRTLIDYYLYLKNNNLDFAYINKELEKLNLLDFSCSIIELIKPLFDGLPLNEKQEEVFLFIASSGTYGILEHSVDKKIKKKGKFKYLLSRVFPPITAYRIKYPWAYKHKALVPIAWFLRLMRGIFKQHKKTKNELKLVKEYKKDKNQ